MSWEKELWPEWTIESEIGSGAYGKVYKIVRQDIGGTYYAALKVISVPRSHDEISALFSANMNEDQVREYYLHFAQELSREFSLMAKLKGNTNIVSYEDHKIVPREDGIGWDILIRMELLTPLTQHLGNSGCDERSTLQLGIDICNALILCEQEGIVHRDIKPGNIFISSHGNYKLGDFGIALTMSKTQTNFSHRGTYMYMAPEVHHGKPYDSTIDIYSLGLILYRLLNNGRAPFLPEPPATLVPQMVDEANNKRLNGMPLPKPLNASVATAGVILKACAYEPEFRYRSAREFQKALERCLAMQGPLNLSKQVAKYAKKAAIAIQELDSETPDLFKSARTAAPDNINDVPLVRHVEEPVEKGKAAPAAKPRMEDLFSVAGDL